MSCSELGQHSKGRLVYVKLHLITSLPDYKKDNYKTHYAYIHYIAHIHTYIHTVELGYNVMKGNENFVSL